MKYTYVSFIREVIDWRLTVQAQLLDTTIVIFSAVKNDKQQYSRFFFIRCRTPNDKVISKMILRIDP